MPGAVSVDVRPGKYAIVTIAQEPVNTLTLALWQELAATLDSLERDPSVRGIIFVSGLKRDVFTAGNDISELYAPKTSAQRYAEFWVTQNRFMARLFRSPLATIAAIRGACPAGGCGISLCCDYRVMTEQGSIGLNEVALGIPVPLFWARAFVRLVGLGPSEKLLQNAVLMPPQQALSVGLVDEVVSKEDLLLSAEERMLHMLKMPDQSRTETKLHLRRDFSLEWEAYCEDEAGGAWQMLTSPKVEQALGAVLQRLQSKGPKAKL